MVSVVDPRTRLLLGGANCQSYDGKTSENAWSERAAIMRSHHRNAWALQESTSAGRAIMLHALGPTWRVWTLQSKSLALMFDTAVWDYKTPKSKSFGTAFGHGAILVPLRNKITDEEIDVIAVHIRPKSVATTVGKLLNVRQAASLAGSRPVVMAGDFALNSPPLVGWKRITPKADSMDERGTQSVDAAFGKKIAGSANAALINPGGLSDHKWFKVDVTIKNTTPSN